MITAGVVMLTWARPAPSAEIEIGLADGKSIRALSGGDYAFLSGLWVTTWGSEDRLVLEFDISAIPSNSKSITFSTALNNFDGLGKSEIDILDFHSYAGDGEITLDEFFAGHLFTSIDYSDNIPPYMIFVDVTEQVTDLLQQGEQYLGLRLSTESSATWAFGETMGIGWPVPTLTVELPTYGATDHAAFVECMSGPGVGTTPECATQFDFDNDADVDLRDYISIQLCFDE